jgi:hypothetical protein
LLPRDARTLDVEGHKWVRCGWLLLLSQAHNVTPSSNIQHAGGAV